MAKTDLLDAIKQDEVLKNYLSDDCSENEICVEMDDKVDNSNYVIIKVDKFYNSLGLRNTPPSPDCLIIQKCKNGGYALAIVELKNISNSQGFTVENMCDKFKTCFDDFISVKFKKYFDIDYENIRLLFVSKIELYKRDYGLAMEVLINKTYRFRNRNYKIQPRMPIPKLKPCY